MLRILNRALLSTLFFSFAVSTFAFDENELVIWVGSDKADDGIREVGKQFTDDYGIKVKVETPENLTDRFQQAAASNNGPDIVFWAHDRYGEWARSGLLASIDPSPSLKRSINKMGWEAMSSNGKIYGYPVSMEAIGLIYNRDILKKPPATFEEMFSLSKKLKNIYPPNLTKQQRQKADRGVTTIMWDQLQPYFSMPFLAADGGYVFKKTSAGYDVKNTGVNNKGAMRGAQMIIDLIDQGVTLRKVDYNQMESRFNNQTAAMMITGPWAWANLKKNKINFGVAPLPSINGKPARPFVGVWGAAINNASPNKSLSKEFLENYLVSEDGLKTLNDDVPLGAVANLKLTKEFSKDPNIAATYQNIKQGLLMPNVPEMGKFWSAMDAALRIITNGQQSYDVALNNAAKLIVK